MKLQYWGTAAAEGFPALFCECEACKRALALGGKNIRSRSSALINDSVMIDFSPDTNWNRLRYNYDMSRLRALCITHSHMDHLAAAELVLQAPNPYRRLQEVKPLPVYCSADSREQIEEAMKFDGTCAVLSFHIWKPYVTEEVDNLRITPLPAVHGEGNPCYIFLVEDGDTRLIYGNDTAFPQEEVFRFLIGKKLSVVSLDCNNGIRPSGRTHMSLTDDARFISKLSEIGCLRENTKFIATHFSHACGTLHDELEQAALSLGFCVAYDGMTIEF